MSLMAELLKEEKTAPKSVRRGDVVEGIVVSKGKDELLLDIGAKSEGLISGDELNDGLGTFERVSPGDKVLATVIQGRSENGMLVLSLRGALKEREWRHLSEVFTNGETIEVRVTGFNKGGLTVDAGGVEGFLPLSHLDLHHFPVNEDNRARGELTGTEAILAELAGEVLPVKIIEFEPQNNRLVLSEKSALVGSFADERRELWESLKPGSRVKGVVTGIAPFGVFVRLGSSNVEGLVHVSEISWTKVSDPAEFYKIGDEVEVEVLSLDPASSKVSLSIKNLQPNPWERFKETYHIGDMIEGSVTKVTPFGAFVKLEEGIEGLIHVSETVGPLSVGERVKAKVVDFKPEEQRLGLSVRGISK